MGTLKLAVLLKFNKYLSPTSLRALYQGQETEVLLSPTYDGNFATPANQFHLSELIHKVRLDKVDI